MTDARHSGAAPSAGNYNEVLEAALRSLPKFDREIDGKHGFWHAFELSSKPDTDRTSVASGPSSLWQGAPISVTDRSVRVGLFSTGGNSLFSLVDSMSARRPAAAAGDASTDAEYQGGARINMPAGAAAGPPGTGGGGDDRTSTGGGGDDRTSTTTTSHATSSRQRRGGGSTDE
jgi:hypothetical protein